MYGMGLLCRGRAGVAGLVLVAGCSLFPTSAPMAGVANGDASAGGGSGGRRIVEAALESGGMGGQTMGGAGAGGGASGSGPRSDAMIGLRDAARDAPSDALSQVADASTERAYGAAITDCIDPAKPNPDTCRSMSSRADGPNELRVDKRYAGYLRFDLDDAFAGSTVLSVRLELTVASYPKAPGVAPAIWEVAPFDRAALFVAAPVQVGASALSESPGAVAAGQTVIYSLPTSAVAAGSSVYLGLVLGGSDASGYWDRDGTIPPMLVVRYR